MSVSNNQKHPEISIGLRELLGSSASELKRHLAGVLVTAIVAAGVVMISEVTSEPQFRSDAEATSLFDDDRGTQLGLDLSGTGDGIPTGLRSLIAKPKGRLFPMVLSSKTVSTAVLESSYEYNIDGIDYRGTLYDYLGTSNTDAAMIILRTRVSSFYIDPATGVTQIIVRTTAPELSKQIAEKYLQALATTLNRIREKSIQLNISAIRGKIDVSSAALAEKETELRVLREQNRDYHSTLDAAFHLEQIRLEREIEMHDKIVVALRSQYELTMSRLLDRDRRLTVITQPSIPTHYESPDLAQAFVLALVVMVIVILTGALLLGGWQQVPGHLKQRWRAIGRLVNIDIHSFSRRFRKRWTVQNVG